MQQTVWIERRVGENLAGRLTAPPAVHDHVALLVVTEGTTTFEQGARYEAGPGDVLLVPAGARHRRLAATNHAMWGIGFCASCYAPSELAALLDPFERARAGGSPVVAIPGDRQAHLEALCVELRRETHTDAGYGELTRKSLLALVLVEVARAARLAAPPDPPPSSVADALRFIERHCLEPISLRDVAAAVHRSPAHLTTALRHATGKTVGEWITAGRMAEARNRLRHTDERVDVIAERVGYADVTHFTRVFRRAHGTTPTGWRAAHRPPRARS